ncbi:MAG: sigma-70 family RNA polymerase sigma factor [Verrucomicrobiales bacterium]|jgi:RNA polymerase sigma-70 factor (ECF subfamily)|nr:sigma-70 family RNA polymerase sigma factor [Verrucomicrobiales bacterium]
MDPLKNPSEPRPDFEALMETVRPRLRAFLLSLTGSEAASEDLTQEVCLILWEKREAFDPSGDFRAWAFRIGFLQAQNYRRKTARQNSRELPGDELFEHIAEVTTERHGRDDEDEKRQQAVLTCLGKLRTAHRDLVLRRYQDEHSLEQLSSEAGINRNAMAQKLFRLKRTLLTCVEKQLTILNRETSAS